MQRMMATVLAIAIGIQLSALAGFSWISPVYAQSETEAPVTITALSARAEREVARMVRTAGMSEDPLLAPDSDAAKPFWASLKFLNDSVLLMSNGTDMKNDSFHVGLNNTVRATAATFATFLLSGAYDDDVTNALGSLEAVVATLEDTYSRPAARARQGGELTEAERTKLDAIKAKQVLLEERLTAIEPKVQNNVKAKAAADEIRRRSNYVRNLGYTVDDFVDAVLSVAVIDGLLYGARHWWGDWGTWYPEFAVGYLSAYEDALVDVAYDWDVDGAITLGANDLPPEDLSVEIDPDAIASDLYEIDTDLSGGLSEMELSGLADVTELDLANASFGFLSGAEVSEMDISNDALIEGLSNVSKGMQFDGGLGSAAGDMLDGADAGDAMDPEDRDALRDLQGGDVIMDLGSGGPLRNLNDPNPAYGGFRGFRGFGDLGMNNLGGFVHF